jgi:3-deoxy-D-manno-octulosonic-acid transferase
MKRIWQSIYYFIVTPGLVILVHILAVFSNKIRKALVPRYSTIARIKEWLDTTHPEGKRILFHTASLGEFEQIRPLLQIYKEKYQTINIVTFFSPSGFENVGQTEGLDFHFYMPIDFPKNWKKIYEFINPSLIAVAKHDVWPAQVWAAHEKGIPIFLINASLGTKSTRTRKGVKRFLKHVYCDFESICAVSYEVAQRFAEHYPRCKVEVVGDTKYDQVVLRKKLAKSQNLLPESWLNQHWIFMAGSIWPQDEEHLLPAIEKILSEEKSIRFVLVPHQPLQKEIEHIEELFNEWGVKRFSRREELQDERILVVDAIGYLAGLYYYAKAAYVGGSFHKGIHNIMEPAIFGIPILYGPVHENSDEAVQLSKANTGMVVYDSNDIYNGILTFLRNEAKRKDLGEKIEKFATRNTGATERLISRWKNLIDKT